MSVKFLYFETASLVNMGWIFREILISLLCVSAIVIQILCKITYNIIAIKNIMLII